MKKMLLVMAVALMSAMVMADEKNFIDQNYIEVEGSVTKEVVPNLVKLSVVLNEKDYKNKTLGEIEREMVKQLKAAGVDVDKDLKVKDVSSDFTRRVLRRNATVTKSYVVNVRDVNTLMKVMRNLDGAGISNIDIAEVTHKDLEKFKKEVKVEAMKCAKEKAVLLSEAIGQSVGRALYISENEPVYTPRRSVNMLYSAKSMAADEFAIEDEVDLEFETIKLRYTVHVRFELK